MKSIAYAFRSTLEKGTENKISRYLALINCHNNPTTSAMFITATTPNPLVVKLVAETTNSNIDLSWTTWALAMLLPGLAAILLMLPVLYFIASP